jgi:sensor histidine kinase YesM
MSRRLLICVTLFFLRSSVCIANDADTLFIHSLDEIDSIPIANNAWFLVDESNQLTWQEAIQKPMEFNPQLPDHIDSAYGRRMVTLWLRMQLTNSMEDSLKMVILFHRYAYYKEVIILKSGDTTIYSPNYFFTHMTKQERKTLNVPLRPGESVTILFRIYNPYSNLYEQEFLLTNRKAYLAMRSSTYHRSYSDYIFKIMFLAVVVFITLHTLVQYFIRRRKEFIFYALYSTSVFLYFLYRLEHSNYYDVLFSHFPYVYKLCNNPLSLLVYYTYFRFARQFLEFQSFAPWFYRVLIWTERVIIANIIIDFICNVVLNNYELREMIFTVVRIALLVISVIGIYLLLSSGKKVLYFFGIGSLILMIGSLLAMIYTFYPQANPWGTDSIKYMQYGIVLELLCFTSGLSYRSYLIEKERQYTQQRLIAQLEENRRLQEELNIRLEGRVKEQMKHIMEQQVELEKEKEQQLTLQFTKKLTEMELQLLKSQLNPHFYFNTLHNLYGLAMIAPRKAPDAILKLSDIMEYVIYDCRNDKVPIAKELRFINSYIELEKLRYDDSANISLQVLGNADGKFISPMLLIQFIENAFKHGLEQYKADSYLNISIDIQNGRLRYESINSINSISNASSGGVGLTNVKKRLDIIYPAKHKLTILSDSTEYKVQLELELN